MGYDNSTRVFILNVMSIEQNVSAGRPEDVVILQLNGTLRPSTRDRIMAAIQRGACQIRQDKKVLA